MIKAQDISCQINHKIILENINFCVHSGEIVSLIGPNGAGKSTLMKIVVGLLKPTKGSLIRKPGLTMGYSPQKMSIDPILPLTVKRFLGLVQPKRNLAEVCAEVEISQALLLQPVQSISGGEWQRVLLARALLQKPDILILDEPAQGVDLKGQATLYALLHDIRDKHGVGILLVSHDLHFVMAGTDTVICLQQHICCQGLPEIVSRDPAFQTLFGPAAEALALYTHHHDHEHDMGGDIVK